MHSTRDAGVAGFMIVVTAVLCALLKEEVGLLVAAMGLYAWVVRGERRLGLVVAGGSLAWDSEHPEVLTIGRRDRPNERLTRDPALLSADARRVADYPGGHVEGYPDGFKNLVGRFYAFIREGRDPQKDAADFPTFEDGHRAALVVDAILRSAKEHAWVTVATN